MQRALSRTCSAKGGDQSVLAVLLSTAGSAHATLSAHGIMQYTLW